MQSKTKKKKLFIQTEIQINSFVMRNHEIQHLITYSSSIHVKFSYIHFLFFVHSTTQFSA